MIPITTLIFHKMAKNLYICTIVETQPGEFVVAYPGYVDRNIHPAAKIEFILGDPYSQPHIRESYMYEGLPYLDARFVVSAKTTLEQFRENVGAVVDRLMSEAASGDQVTLKAIKAALQGLKYKVI